VIGFVAALAALLYCFVWLRPPELGGVALPIQRVLGWAGLTLLLIRLLIKGPLTARAAGRSYLWWVAAFGAFLLLMFVRQLAYGENFFPLYFIMDLSKYAAAFAMAYLCYYALAAGLVSENRMIRFIVYSGVAATLLVYVFLALYFAGFRTETQLIAPSFGGALGVWPTDALLPRLAGPTAEPQQLSVALLTPLLLMLSPKYLQRFWPAGVLAVAALLLSQSKFALISLLVVGLYLMVVYPRARVPLGLAGLVTIPIVGALLLQLPTLRDTLQSGLSAGAFVERLGNLLLLVGIIREHPFVGIGAGHYGAYRGQVVFGDAMYSPGYTPNMDFLKVFAETGVLGFVLLLLLLGFLVRRFVRGYGVIPAEKRPVYLALLLGALTIMLNMTIGYELLHAFFWINVGMLLYYVDWSSGRGETMVPGSHAGLSVAPAGGT
jgi:O-antigen ligase